MASGTAATTYTTADDLRYSAIINEQVIKELRGANVTAKLCRQESLVGKASLSMDFPKWPHTTAAALTEATDMTSTTISTTKATVTAAEVGITDLIVPMGYDKLAA